MLCVSSRSKREAWCDVLVVLSLKCWSWSQRYALLYLGGFEFGDDEICVVMVEMEIMDWMDIVVMVVGSLTWRVRRNMNNREKTLMDSTKCIWHFLFIQGGDHANALSRTGAHIWFSTTHAVPTYCNVCREQLCGKYCHVLCAHLFQSWECRSVLTSGIFEFLLQPENSVRFLQVAVSTAFSIFGTSAASV